MRRPLATAGLVAALAVPTLAVVWAGLGWPPPLWVVEYGLPGSQGPTGRVAEIEGIEFVEISRGLARIGSLNGTAGGDLVERVLGLLTSASHRIREYSLPPAWVRFDRPFWIGRTEATRSDLPESARPMVPPGEDGRRVASGLTWTEAVGCCAEWARLTGVPIRLPRETEWEVACRAGFQGIRETTGLLRRTREVSWNVTRAHGELQRPATLAPNAWGLHDLQGNAWEWCRDRSGGGGASAARTFRVVRGGSVIDPVVDCLPWSRTALPQGGAYPVVGFRPAFSLGPGEEPLVEPYLVEGN